MADTLFAELADLGQRLEGTSKRLELTALLADFLNPDNPEITPEDLPKVEKLIELLLANAKVTNGPFYFNAEDKLCGTQTVRFGKCSEILTALNRCIPMMLRDHSKQEETTEADKNAIAAFISAGTPEFMQMNGNAFIVRWPMSDF